MNILISEEYFAYFNSLHSIIIEACSSVGTPAGLVGLVDTAHIFLRRAGSEFVESKYPNRSVTLIRKFQFFFFNYKLNLQNTCWASIIRIFI